MGRGITDLITDRAEVDFLREVNKSIAAEDIWQGEILNRRKNSESFALNVIITPIRDDENKIVNYIGIGQDITRQKEIDRQILQTIISTEEKERSRFAQDLHDELGPLLSTAKLYIRSFETAKDDKNREIAITRSMMAIDEAIMSIKQIANNISPHVLRNFGLTSGIQSFINKINEANTLRINFRTEVEERFDENMESSLFRIVAELVNNTIKHANASHAEISLRRTAKMLVLNYSDDGVGFRLEDALDKKLARGITNIINRSKSLGGDIAFGNSPKTGFSVSIKIPVATHIITPRQN